MKVWVFEQNPDMMTSAVAARVSSYFARSS